MLLSTEYQDAFAKEIVVLGVRTRSGSDGIDHPRCALIGSLPLAVLTHRRRR